MIKKTISYTDYNDVSKTEDFYFNITKSELMLLDTDQKRLQKMINDNDKLAIVTMFKTIILAAYGEKSDDGRFIKTEEKAIAFSQTGAFETLFMEIASDGDVADAFIKGILPVTIAMNADLRTES